MVIRCKGLQKIVIGILRSFNLFFGLLENCVCQGLGKGVARRLDLSRKGYGSDEMQVRSSPSGIGLVGCN